MGPTSLYLVRAARTTLSAEGRFRGLDESPLDERGRAEAGGAARRFAPAGIVAVYTSPLLRARQTAEPIARAAGVESSVLEDLADLDFGAWTALTLEEAALAHPDHFDRWMRFPQAAAAPGGERLPDAERRAFEALGEIARRHPRGPAVAVTHEILIRLVLVRLRGHDGSAMWDPDLPTGSITVLRMSESGPELPSPLEELLRASRVPA